VFNILILGVAAILSRTQHHDRDEVQGA